MIVDYLSRSSLAMFKAESIYVIIPQYMEILTPSPTYQGLSGAPSKILSTVPTITPVLVPTSEPITMSSFAPSTHTTSAELNFLPTNKPVMSTNRSTLVSTILPTACVFSNP